jgi:hypothetical protein
MCGACADELQLYLGCAVDALTTGCQFSCATSGAAKCRRRLATVGMIVAALGGLM